MYCQHRDIQMVSVSNIVLKNERDSDFIFGLYFFLLDMQESDLEKIVNI